PSSLRLTTHPTPLFSPLSLHDALPIFPRLLWLLLFFLPREHHQPLRRRHHRGRHVRSGRRHPAGALRQEGLHLRTPQRRRRTQRDRKSTRLNSSHVKISYAVFCLKKKK